MTDPQIEIVVSLAIAALAVICAYAIYLWRGK